MIPDSSFSTRSRVVCAQDVHRLPWVSTPTFGHPVLAETSVPCRQTCVPSGGDSPPHAGEPLTVASLLPLLFPPLPHHAQGALGPWGAGERPEPTSPRHSSFLISSFSSFLLSQFAALSPRIFMESADHSGQGLLQRRLHHGVQSQRLKGEGESTFPRNPDPIANPSPSFSFKWDQSLARGPQCLRTGCSVTRSKLGRARA